MNPHEPRAGFPSYCLQPVFLCVGPGTDPLYLSGGEVRAAHCLGFESQVGFTCAAGPRGDGHPWLENAGMREIQPGLLTAHFCSFVSETYGEVGEAGDGTRWSLRLRRELWNGPKV